jgi:hypothetical protein
VRCGTLLSLLCAVEWLTKVAVVWRKQRLCMLGSPLLLGPRSSLACFVERGFLLRGGVTVRRCATWWRQWPGGRHGGNHGAHGRGDSDRIWISIRSTFNFISRGQKGVETLNQVRITSEKGRNALNDTRSIYGTALEILHDVQEAVVNIGMIGELDFDLVEVAKSVLSKF